VDLAGGRNNRVLAKKTGAAVLILSPRRRAAGEADRRFLPWHRWKRGRFAAGTCRADMEAMTRVRCCAVLLAAWFGLPRAAHAIGACVCNDRGWTLPAFSRAMPLRPRLFVSVRDPGPFTVRLFGRDGVDVPIDVIPAGGAPGNLWVSPRAPLAPATSYGLQAGPARAGVAPDLTAGFGFDTVTADLADVIDRQAPTVTDLRIEPGGLADNCNTITGGSTITARAVIDDAAPDTLVQLDVTVGRRIERLFLPFRAGSWRGGVGIGAATYDTGTDCLGDQRLPGGEVGKRYPTRISVWDWSGNATIIEGQDLVLGPNPSPSGPPGPTPSPTSTPADAGSDDASPTDRSSGCQMGSTPGPNPPLGLLAVGALVALLFRVGKRRRRGAR
jgi:MYXO-CTERM domain-containing protein